MDRGAIYEHLHIGDGSSLKSMRCALVLINNFHIRYPPGKSFTLPLHG